MSTTTLVVKPYAVASLLTQRPALAGVGLVQEVVALTVASA